jgi:hypothetical protein
MRCASVQATLMSVVCLFVTALPKTPAGLLQALWRSFANLADPGHAPETISPGAHIAVLGRTDGAQVTRSRHASFRGAVGVAPLLPALIALTTLTWHSD